MRTCFVISPIGSEESQERESADDLFDLIVVPALETYEFDVIRADKIQAPGVITDDIVTYVQNSELCIIDLTGHNANVFYESGRRHETGKPFIQLLKKGERLPFDVAGIRTVFYDLSDPRAVRATVGEIRKYVEAISSQGFPMQSSGGSIAAVADTLDRVERKLDKVLVSGLSGSSLAMNSTQQAVGGNPLDIMRRRDNPERVFLRAITTGDLSSAANALKQLVSKVGYTDNTVAATMMAASSGIEDSAIALLELIDDWPDGLEEISKGAALRAVSQFYVETERADEGIARIGSLLSALVEDSSLSDDDRSSISNALQRMYYSDRNLEKAQEWALRAIKFKQDEPALWFNISLVYEGRDLLDLAEDAIESALALDVVDGSLADYLAQAIDIYDKRGNEEKAAAAMMRLQSVDPEEAEMKLLTRAIAKLSD